MSTNAGMSYMVCQHCGRPAAVGVWLGGSYFHAECTRGPAYEYRPNTYGSDCVPLSPLTEERVREIVREELGRTK